MTISLKQNEQATRPFNITRAKDLFSKVQNQPDPIIGVNHKSWGGIEDFLT